MRKIMWLLMVTLLLLNLTGCTKSNPELNVAGEAGNETKIVLEEGDGLETNDEISSLAEMYIEALDSLIEMDPGLNGGMEYIAIDCETLPDLEDEDIEALLTYFSETYALDTMNKSVSECFDEGYGNKENLLLDGIVLYVENADIGKNKATLECVKYRSGLGAIGVTVKLKYEDQWIVEETMMTWIS